MADLKDILGSGKPKGDDQPQGTAAAPQPTATAPQGTAVAPQAPQGTATAPQGTAAPAAGAPLSTGSQNAAGAFSAGTEANLFKLPRRGKNYCLKVFKDGYHSNVKVIKALAHLKGKGYFADVLESGKLPKADAEAIGHPELEGKEYELSPLYPLGSVAGMDFKGKADAILAIIVKTALALDNCHKAGVLHKDVKPANILLADQATNDTVLCDFGIAALIEKGGKCVTEQFRTPIYAAPEVYDPANAIVQDGVTYVELTPAADFYSLGMTALCLWQGETVFRSREAAMAFEKKRGAIAVPSDMPEPLHRIVQGLLISIPGKRWGLAEIRRYLGGEDVPAAERERDEPLGIVWNSARNQIASSLSELVALMKEDPNTAMRYLYNGQLQKWLKDYPDLVAKLDEIVEDRYPDPSLGAVFVAIWVMDPLADLLLCSDPTSPDYAMTQEGIGKALNRIYDIYFHDYHGNIKRVPDSPGLPTALVAGILLSFYEGRTGLLEDFFWAKNGRFSEQENWLRYCKDTSTTEFQQKAGPKSQEYCYQMAIMKTIAGYGVEPQFDFTNLTDPDAQGIMGYLAVKHHENPHTNFKRKYAYEKALEAWLEEYGNYVPDAPAVLRYNYACQVSKTDYAQGIKRYRKLRTRSFLQYLGGILLGLIPAVLLLVALILAIIDNPTIDIDAVKFKWVFYLIAPIVAGWVFIEGDFDGCLVPILLGALGAGLVLLIIQFLGPYLLYFVAAALLALIVYLIIVLARGSKDGRLVRLKMAKPKMFNKTLELHYAFASDDATFDDFLSQYGDAFNDSFLGFWDIDVSNRTRPVLISIAAVVVLTLMSALLPHSRRLDKATARVETVVSKSVPTMHMRAQADTVSYLAGWRIARDLVKQGYPKVNYKAFEKGARDAFKCNLPKDDVLYADQFDFDPATRAATMELYAKNSKEKFYPGGLTEKVSYFLGMDYAAFYGGYDLPPLKYKWFRKGYEDYGAAKGKLGDTGYERQFLTDPAAADPLFRTATKKQNR